MSDYIYDNFMTSTTDKVLVALSGGVDSSVCVRILQDQGFAVEGLVIEFSPAHTAAVKVAQAVAAQLKIPLHIKQCHALFEEKVIAPFCAEYCEGKTPSPCIRCNPEVKFRVLAETADELGFPYIATGHYAKLETAEDGTARLLRADSTARDQSYMLYRLPQSILQRLLLPLGEFEKEEVRDIARESGLASAEAPDSQEICFIPDNDYPAFIERRGLAGKPGRFIGPDGEDLGAHKGVLHYTVGQRRGLNLALGRPVFVKRILENGNVLLAWQGDEFYSSLQVEEIATVSGRPFEAGEYTVKIRSAAKPTVCTVALEGDVLQVSFPAPVRAPAPGQSAVFYRGDEVIGGGVIRDMS